MARFTPEQLAAASERTVPDLIRPGLRVLFCGINPGLYSAASGTHFARPGNRFWKVLHLSGFTDRLLDPSEQRVLLDYGIGISNIVDRASTAAAELTTAELREGATQLRRKIVRQRPALVAFLGILAYRKAFAQPRAALGRQPDTMAIGTSVVWVLPNPSGLQARYQLPELVSLFGALREAAEGG